MKEEEITALSREYAEEEGKHDIEQGFGKSFAKDMLEFNEKEFKSVLEFLLRRYCLVEKSKLEDKYKSSKNCFEHTDSSNPTQKQYFWGRICAIESLFPEIAKEVEE